VSNKPDPNSPKSVLLYAPEVVRKMSPRKFKSGGCGADGWKVDIVPDTIWGLNIRNSCRVHDAMYGFGIDESGLRGSEENKAHCDRVFLNNLLREINFADSWGWLKALRRRRAKTYYWAVVNYGGPAYWEGKNKNASYNVNPLPVPKEEK